MSEVNIDASITGREAQLSRYVATTPRFLTFSPTAAFAAASFIYQP
jgi:hypothetical protein